MQDKIIINFLLGVLLFLLGGVLWFVRYVLNRNDEQHREIEKRIDSLCQSSNETSDKLNALETEHKLLCERRRMK